MRLDQGARLWCRLALTPTATTSYYDKAVHALCNAHHLRELDEVAASSGQGWAAELSEWLSVARWQAERARDTGQARVDAQVLAGLLGRYEEIIAKGHAANPPPPRPPGRRGRIKHSPD